MPYPRTSTSYPAAMRVLIEEIAADNLARQIEFDSPREAYSQRSRFYAFIAAVKRDLTTKPAWMDEKAAADLTSFLQRAMLMEFVIEGRNLTIRPRDESPFAAKLRFAKIVGEPSPPTEDSAAEASLSSLLEKINVKS